METETTNEPGLLVQLVSDERLEADPDTTEAGVLTDAGIIPWAEVAAFWCWSKAHGRWMAVPVDGGAE